MIINGYKNKKDNISFNPENMEKLKKHLSKYNQGEEIVVKVYSKKEQRSIKQNEYYFSKIIPCLQYYDDSFKHCCDPKEKDSAHYQAKLTYCIEKRTDLIEYKKFRTPKEGLVERAFPFSWKVSEMPTKEANDYINWCVARIEAISGVVIDKAIAEMNQ